MSVAVVSEAVIAVSVVMQFGAGIAALKLIPLTGARLAWSLVAVGLIGMGFRRLMSFFALIEARDAAVYVIEYELIGLGVSALMFAGVLMIRPLFLSIAQNNEKLAASEARHRAFVLRSREGIIAIDSSTGEILEANPYLTEITGFSRDELARMTIFDLVCAGEDTVRRNLDKVVESGWINIGRRVYRRKDGGEAPVEVSAALIETGSQKVVYAVVHDYSAQRKAEEEREKVVEELKAALSKVKLLSGFLPICAQCKKIRNDEGYWTQIEEYISARSEADFTHGICPECSKKILNEFMNGR